MYHAACKVEFQPFKRLYSRRTFFNFYKKYWYTQTFHADPKCSTDKSVTVLDHFHHSRCICLLFVCFYLFLLHVVYLPFYLFCASWLSFCLSFSLSELLAYACCACHSPAHNGWWHGIALLTTAVYTVAACDVVLWQQSSYLEDEESAWTLAVLDVDK